MILPTPRVIAIDDDLTHLAGLTEGLNWCGTACSPIHFTDDMGNIQPCPHVRVIFADLNLIPGQTSPSGNFSTIGSLIEDKIRPSGPYFIILWTINPEEADKLHEFLKRLSNVMKPLAVQALDKTHYLEATSGKVKSTEKLAEAIQKMVAGQTQVAALFDWETRTSDAAADTVSSILKLAEATATDEDRAKEIGRLLTNLAAGAVGDEHVEEDRFQAVNGALLPILADRIASIHSQSINQQLWQNALVTVKQTLSLDEATKLNSLLHIAPLMDKSVGTERGTVITLPKEFSGKSFEPYFGLPQETASQKQFWCKDFKENDVRFRWVLVQTQAACDYAQTQPGPAPFHLGLYLPAEKARKGTPPAALWSSPSFEWQGDELQGEARLLHVNARFQVSLPSTKRTEVQPLFRLREQLLNDMIYRLHSHGARPGIISFRES